MHGRAKRSAGRGGRRAHDDAPVQISEALGEVVSRLGAGRVEVVASVFTGWERIVGSSVAAHVRPLRVDGTTLVVAADHPAWATQLRHMAPEILARVAQACGGTDAPQRLEIRVRP